MTWIGTSEIRLEAGEAVRLRSARPRDARGVLALTRASLTDSAYLIQTPEEFAPSIRRTRAWLKRLLASPSEIALIAEMSGEIVGLLDTVTEPRRRLSHATRFGLLVAGPVRSRGIGRAMVRRLIDWARAHEAIERIELHVHADNVSARGLYASLGFVEEGVRRRAIKYEDGRYMDDIIMALLLDRLPDPAGASESMSRAPITD